MRLKNKRNKMTNIKLERFEKQILGIVTPIILNYTKEKWQKFVLVSVISVKLSVDYNYADIFVTCEQNEKDLLKFLSTIWPVLKREISRVLSLRKTPQVRFKIDKEVGKVSNIYSILNSIKEEIWDE